MLCVSLFLVIFSILWGFALNIFLSSFDVVPSAYFERILRAVLKAFCGRSYI